MTFSSGLMLFLLTFILPATGLHARHKVKLFQPKDTSAWHVYTSKAGTGKDPLKVFQFEGKMIHVSGEDFAYLVTEKDYANFHLTLEFKWGTRKYPPRENAKRDAGVLYHAIIYNGDKIWPRSLEYQIQEGDCGDFWMTDSTTIYHHDTLTKPAPWYRGIKAIDAEKPNGEWNKAEVIVKDGKITHLLNGQVVNEGRPGNTTTGKIVIQSEGAELFYRKIIVQEM